MNEYTKNLNRIEFVVTMACTGKCKHCSEGDHTNCPGSIDADIAVKSIRELCDVYRIESLMTFGGESLLYPDVVCAIHKTATEIGIPQRQLITNGFFTKKNERIKEVAGQLGDSGVNELLLSVDAFHQETIPLAPVKHFAECVLQTGIPMELSPAWLVSPDDDNVYNNKTREILEEFVSLGIPVGAGNVIFPSGNALKYFGEYFDKDNVIVSPYEEDPRDVRAIGFSPNGDVLNGNVYKKDILTIIEEYKP